MTALGRCVFVRAYHEIDEEWVTNMHKHDGSQLDVIDVEVRIGFCLAFFFRWPCPSWFMVDLLSRCGKVSITSLPRSPQVSRT